MAGGGFGGRRASSSRASELGQDNKDHGRHNMCCGTTHIRPVFPTGRCASFGCYARFVDQIG